MPNLMHLVSMQQAAGVEAHFAEFVTRAASRDSRWQHSWLNPARTMHPFFHARLQHTLSETVHAKYRRGLKLPGKPAWFRAQHFRRALAKIRPDVLLVWNRTAKIGYLVDAIGEENCIHWEHGAAWHSGRERDRTRYLSRVPIAVANSNASARVLQLKWGYPGEIRVCRNALRHSLIPAQPLQKQYPQNSAIRLGIAARLVPVKGVALALHAVKRLRAESLDVELQVAGTGSELEPLRTLAHRLNVESAVRFLGSQEDMRVFYADIHCLLHPPLTEAFGLVAIEAAAHGTPVIAAGVDGLPEAVAEGVTGFCVNPALELSEYGGLGGGYGGIPEQVYDPEEDALREPGIVDPGDLADTVLRLFSSAEGYERMSLAASEHVLREYQFDRHVEEVMAIVEGSRVR